MRRTIFLALAVSLFVAAGAAASTQPASGSFTQLPATLTDERQADGNFIIELTRKVVLTGTYVGTGEAEERIVIHKDGSTNVQGTILFSGLACGVPTTLVFLLAGQGQLDPPTFETGTIEGSYTILREGIGHGNGKFSGAAGVGGTYEGQAHCE